MQRLWEILLGLDRGFLSKEGEFVLDFNPRWPLQDAVGAGTWNFVLAMGIVALVVYVYRREGHRRSARILLGVMRLVLLAFVLAMLNRPVLTLAQSRTEPSVLAIAIDDSISMQVRDGTIGADGRSATRLNAAIDLLTSQDHKLLRDLSRRHVVKLYRFSRDAQPIATITQETFAARAPATRPVAELAGLQPAGQATQVLRSLRTVLEELQGQRLAGLVVLTDGRDTPAESLADGIAAIKNFGTRVYPVSVGSDSAPQNIVVESVTLQDAAFVKDIVSVRAQVRAAGYPPGHQVTVLLRDKKTGAPLVGSDGKTAVQETIVLSGDAAQEVELNFRPTVVGALDVSVEAVRQNGEIDEQDNVRTAQIAVLDARIAVLYCEGYPRWDYRYIKNEMIRDRTVDISCLLFSADPGFAQEGDKPITRFPESMSEMLEYDVVLFGDVDPRQFTDAQIQLVHDFVARKGGGFGMIAGPRWSPQAFRDTPIESVLPVMIGRIEQEPAEAITAGFRPVLTSVGQSSTIFRFFENRAVNERFLREEIQPLFWYRRGITAKPGMGEVYAEHPSDLGPDGRKAPILVLGRFGAGRTLFSAIDDSWRWRFYTGESVFDTYWVQQIRYLARAKKLGQRRFTLTSLRPMYELGDKIEVSLRVLDPELIGQLPEQIGVNLEATDGQTIRQETLQRREGQNDLYVASWTADTVGRFTFRLPPLASGSTLTELPIEVQVPRLELTDPRVNRDLLSRLAAATSPVEQAGGPDLSRMKLNAQTPAEVAAEQIMKIPSAAMIVPVYTSQPLWNAPLAMAIFVLLITLEWVLRKVYGML